MLTVNSELEQNNSGTLLSGGTEVGSMGRGIHLSWITTLGGGEWGEGYVAEIMRCPFFNKMSTTI